jgi:hypothetical protein
MDNNNLQAVKPQLTNANVCELLKEMSPDQLADAVDLERIQDPTTRLILRTALTARIRLAEHLSIEDQSDAFSDLKFDN